MNKFMEDETRRRRHSNSEEEWPCYRGKSPVTGPFLIRELQRLTPYVDGAYICFCPLNMPDLKLGRISILGSVVRLNFSYHNVTLRINDGTGEVSVFINKKVYESYKAKRNLVDEKYQWLAESGNIKSLKVNKNYGTKRAAVHPDFKYSSSLSTREIALLEQHWWFETQKGMLGKTIEVGDYVLVSGYYQGRFPRSVRLYSNTTHANTEYLYKLKNLFYVLHVKCLTESEYCVTMDDWLNNDVKSRYTDR